ncbi:unnamed protein product [Arctogadus glacialis]
MLGDTFLGNKLPFSLFLSLYISFSRDGCHVVTLSPPLFLCGAEGGGRGGVVFSSTSTGWIHVAITFFLVPASYVLKCLVTPPPLACETTPPPPPPLPGL